MDDNDGGTTQETALSQQPCCSFSSECPDSHTEKEVEENMKESIRQVLSAENENSEEGNTMSRSQIKLVDADDMTSDAEVDLLMESFDSIPGRSRNDVVNDVEEIVGRPTLEEIIKNVQQVFSGFKRIIQSKKLDAASGCDLNSKINTATSSTGSLGHGGTVSESKYNGIVYWNSGTKSKVRLSGSVLQGIKKGVVTWDDGSTSDIMLKFDNSSDSRVGMPLSFGSPWMTDSDSERTADSPPHLQEFSVGLVPVYWPAPLTAGVHKNNVALANGSADDPESDSGSAFPPTQPSKKKKKLMSAGIRSSSRLINERYRNMDNKSRQPRPMIIGAEAAEKKKQKALSTAPYKKTPKPQESEEEDYGEEPMLAMDANGEPQFCKRCDAKVHGMDHFYKFHNGLLLEEQETFSVEKKRVRWNNVVKKKHKLRCQRQGCGKLVASSTGLQYHESTCGKDIKKEECPICEHWIAASYIKQHVMNHNRQAGLFTRQRKTKPELPASASNDGSKKRKTTES